MDEAQRCILLCAAMVIVGVCAGFLYGHHAGMKEASLELAESQARVERQITIFVYNAELLMGASTGVNVRILQSMLSAIDTLKQEGGTTWTDTTTQRAPLPPL